MKPVAAYEYTLRTNDFDCRRKLMPSAVLDLFQNAAGRHAYELGVGFDAMLQKDVLWVIVRVRFQILRTPPLYSRVKITTWPLPPTRASCRRDYVIEDEGGQTVVKGTSEWVFMHSTERKLLPATDIYPLDEFCDTLALEDKTSKLRDFEPEGQPFDLTAGFCDLDMNGHVNNTKYANFVLDAVPLREDEEIEFFQLDYRKEVRAGEKLSLLSRRNEGEIVAKGLGEDGGVRFACRIGTKGRL